jgi:hypothetical protein
MENQETLLTSTVPRSLESKSKILGLELIDVILLLLNLSIQNLVFGSTVLRLPMVFGTSACFALVLFLFKRGKPDQFLQHYIEYIKTPTIRSANGEDREYRPFRMSGEL